MASNAEKRNTKERKLNWKQLVVLYLHDWLFLLIAIFLLFLLLFRVIVVSGDSMYETLWDGDYLLLLSNTFYHEPKYGDVVVISKESFDDGKPIIKRVIATEGQTVDIDFDQGIVYVDGLALQEDYTHNLTTREEGTQFPLVVGVSLDSRSQEIGQIDRREVLGKAIFLMLPGTNHNEQPRDFDRVGVIQ